MIAKSTIDKFQDQLNKILTDKKHQIELLGYITVFLTYLFTHLINLVEYPSFDGDEMFYVLKAVIWQKTGTPSMPGWDGNFRPEFTNPPTLSWIYMVLFGIFGTTPLVQRLVMLIIGIINLLFVFLVGRETGGTENPRSGYLIGILAGLFLALDHEFICYSRTGYLDNPMNLCLTISLYFFLRYLRTENQNYTWVAGFAAGIALWFKLSACYFLIGLGLFALITRKINAVLRVQAVMTFFLGLFVLWGFSIDPVAFVKGITFQLDKAPSGFTLTSGPFPPLLWMLYWLHFPLYDYGGPNFDLFRTLFFFSIFIPIYYIRKRNSLFNEKSFLV
ncbi:MAG: ArnT family glycosyltransferase, partial [Candidatus Hermodarchaeota archaeon]